MLYNSYTLNTETTIGGGNRYVCTINSIYYPNCTGKTRREAIKNAINKIKSFKKS